MTSEQLAAFAMLVGESSEAVRQHLEMDRSLPGLLPLAVAAADARIARKRAGKIHTAVGFSIFGVGAITGSLLISTSFSAVGGGYSIDGGRIGFAIVVVAISAGVGLPPLGIVGIVEMARRSEAENSAVDHYQRASLPASSRVSESAVHTGYALQVPLLSLVFWPGGSRPPRAFTG
jgi:hypothetical protein